MNWQVQPPAHLLFCFPLTTPTPMPSKVFLVRKVTRPDSGHLYAMKVLKKATLKGEWRAPPRRASGWAEIEGRGHQVSGPLGLMGETALSPGIPGLKM